MQVSKTNGQTVPRRVSAPTRKAVKPLGDGAAASVTAAATKAAPAQPGKKVKLVRAGLSIPKGEYKVLAALKLRAAQLAQPAKKTALLRAGIQALAAMPDAAFVAALRALPSLKTTSRSK